MSCGIFIHQGTCIDINFQNSYSYKEVAKSHRSVFHSSQECCECKWMLVGGQRGCLVPISCHASINPPLGQLWLHTELTSVTSVNVV